MFQSITQIVKIKLFFYDSKWRRMALSYSKKLSALIGGITSKYHGGFYCLNCFRSFPTANKRESYKKVLENKDFCNVVMPSEDSKILKFNQYQKSENAPFVIYAHLEEIFEYKNIPENSFTTKAGKHISLIFPMSAISSLKSIENKHDVYTGKDSMKKFCESLKEHAMKVINFK